MRRYSELILLLVLTGRLAAGEDSRPPGPWDDPPKLPRPTGKVVLVKAGDAADLQAKVRAARSGETVAVPPGEYRLTAPLRIGMRGPVKRVALRGTTGDFADVVILGPGMRVDSRKTVPHCLMIENAVDTLVADVSLGDVWFHPITLQANAGCERVRVYHCRLFEAGEQFLKGNTDGKGGGVDGGVVEYCVFEYADTSRWYYTEGVDVHRGEGWIVRHNLFRNIRGPAEDPNVGGAIDFWNNCRNTVVEGNLIWNCRFGIRLGMVHKSAKEKLHDHVGGIVRNNIIYREPGAVHSADIGITVNDCPGAKVHHNTVILGGTFQPGRGPMCIEYRWSKDVDIRNNLCDGGIWQREDAAGSVEHNLLDARPEWFVDAAAGDLHLTRRARAAIDKVRAPAGCERDYDGEERGKQADVGADEVVPKN